MSINPHFSKQQISHILQVIFKLYEKENNNLNTNNVSSSSSSTQSSSFSFNLLHMLGKKQRISLSLFNELLLYKQTPRLEGFDDTDLHDILSWWRNNVSYYPILAKVAKDVLIPPVSTVPSESAFSASGRLLTEKRTNLVNNTLKALICIKNWKDAEKRMQRIIKASEDDEQEIEEE